MFRLSLKKKPWELKNINCRDNSIVKMYNVQEVNERWYAIHYLFAYVATNRDASTAEDAMKDTEQRPNVSYYSKQTKVSSSDLGNWVVASTRALAGNNIWN